jgi:hypothetical protein
MRERRDEKMADMRGDGLGWRPSQVDDSMKRPENRLIGSQSRSPSQRSPVREEKDHGAGAAEVPRLGSKWLGQSEVRWYAVRSTWYAVVGTRQTSYTWPDESRFTRKREG